jgi:radical SAM superfamily enzyme YgiQ (UPF0313 family)
VRVLLLSINRLRFPYPVYPLGLDHLAGALGPRHEVRILDLGALEPEEEEGALAAAVRGFAPQAVGLSIRNVDNSDATHAESFVPEMRAAAERVRRLTGAPLVLGGAGYTLYPAELLAVLGADWGVVGEGEQAPALFDALAAGRSPEGLPGVAAPGRPAPRPAPTPGRLRAPRAPPGVNPALGFYASRGGILNLQTQRGCAFRCVYCTYPAIEGAALRRLAAAEAAETARRLQDSGARFLFLTDSVFNGDPGHCLAVADAFRAAGLSIPWGAFFSPLSPPDGFYQRLAEAGCTHVEFGTESLSEDMLPRLRKGFRRKQALDAHAAARAAGMHVAHFFLLGGPGETRETLADSLDGAEALEGAVLFFFAGMRIYPGTELEHLARAAGQVVDGQSLLEPVFYQPPEMPLPALAEEAARRSAGRGSWVVGDGAARAGRILARLHASGHAGPLWERLAEA